MLSTINYSITVSFWRLLFWNELTEISGNADARNALSARNANADEGAEEEISDTNLVNVHVTVKVGWSIQRSQVCIKSSSWEYYWDLLKVVLTLKCGETCDN